ncbi:elongation of very long chain fatty acids protein 6-like [Triplophysa dalaica]|uniref:elongation of very long chain fatty acids protein 6-like n=1 Tax=Triplophysa dalaica TaxID=1582913 RepID=UPI0024DFCEB8|nr:elongation of very long chain fatty acids protein 6-like [Triplophysa dalaica]
MNETLHAFDFERQFDDRAANEWFQVNSGLSFVFSGTYAAGIYFGRVFMKDRQKFDLRTPLMLWSLCLAVFSAIGAVRTSWYVINLLSSDGFHQTVCDTAFFGDPVSKFWAFAFTISKVPELGDTVFIVLRKQRLIFLHWYHHITVLLYTWYSYRDRVAGGCWFMSMNYTVHAVMYGYYAAKAGGLRVPRPVAVLITALQIVQMIVGFSLMGLMFRWRDEVHCVANTNNLIYGSVMYLSYLLLFSSFFYQSYIRGAAGPDHKRPMKRE